jgi:HSP20 family protein
LTTGVINMVNRRRRDFDEYRDDWRDEFGDFFDDFGFDFDRFNERMMKIWSRFLKDPDVSSYGPYVYGFTYKVGPDGKPVFEEFGNVPGTQNPLGPAKILDKNVREPITDINEDQKKIYITYELPGVSKENIELNVSQKNVTISVKEDTRKYYKSIDLQYKIKPETAQAKFKNGILDLIIEKVTDETTGGRKIQVE